MSKKKRADNTDTTADTKAPKDKSAKVFQRDKLNFDLHLHHRDDLTAKQLGLLDLIADKKTNIVFINGPAGTSKTFLAVYAALLALEKKSQSDIVYIRSIIESASKSMGALPGDADEKLLPFIAPLYDKLEELIDKPDIDRLLKENRIKGMPVNFVRGSSWNAKFIIVDESQNLTPIELKTIITRMGKYSKMIIMGDSGQTDLKEKSGFMPLFDLFSGEESHEYGIHTFSFDKKDIVRSKILGYILDRIEGTYTPPSHSEPMFPDDDSAN